METSEDTFVNVIAQCRPHYEAKSEGRYEEISRRITSDGCRPVLDHARAVGRARVENDPTIAGREGDPLPWR